MGSLFAARDAGKQLGCHPVKRVVVGVINNGVPYFLE